MNPTTPLNFHALVADVMAVNDFTREEAWCYIAAFLSSRASEQDKAWLTTPIPKQ